MMIDVKETVKTFRLSKYCWLFGVLDFLGFEVPKFITETELEKNLMD